MIKRLNFKPLIICFIFIISSFFSINVNAQQTRSSSECLLNMILQKESKYSAYNVDIVSGKYDVSGDSGYFFVFTEKTTKEDECPDHCADIWYGSGSKVSNVGREQYILPDTYGNIKIAGRTYFRYDLAYATDSQTILLGVTKGICSESFRAPGPAEFDSSNTFKVMCSSYDLIKFKGEAFFSGHTWKNYYFFADSKGFHEYTAKQINSKDFNKYANAGTIIKNLNKKYSKADSKVSYRFLKRSNNLIHINIDIENGDSTTHYYCTCRIAEKNKLIQIDSGEGSYINAVSELK